LDNGTWPGLAFCDFRPGYYLIADSQFLGDQQYSGSVPIFARMSSRGMSGGRSPSGVVRPLA
jgi:hypothetical protein